METFANRRSRTWLALTGLILGLGWLFVSLLLAPAIGAPQPLTGIGVLALLGFGFLLVSSKTPIAVGFDEETITIRHLVRRNLIQRDRVTFVEYRLLKSQAGRGLERRYYGVSIWYGKRRKADVSLDGPIARRLMSWADSVRSVLRIYEGRRLAEERRP